MKLRYQAQHFSLIPIIKDVVYIYIYFFFACTYMYINLEQNELNDRKSIGGNKQEKHIIVKIGYCR